MAFDMKLIVAKPPPEQQTAGPIESLIRRARERITDPSHWTQGALARDKDGLAYVTPTDPRAASWCHNGAFVAEGAFVINRWPDRLEPLLSPRDFQRFVRCMKAAFARTKPRANHEIVINNFHHPRMAHAAVLRLMDRAADHAAAKGWRAWP